MSHNHDALHRRRWAAVRRAVLDAAGWRCQRCGAARRMEVDHVTPLARGGDPYDPANLQALCFRCHRAKTRRENLHGRPRPAWDALVAESVNTFS